MNHFAVISRKGTSATVPASQLDSYCTALLAAGDAVQSVIPVTIGAGVINTRPAVATVEEIRSAVGAARVANVGIGGGAPRGWDVAPNDAPDSPTVPEAPGSETRVAAAAEDAARDARREQDRTAGTVSEEARERVQADRAALEAFGVKTADAHYAEGARVNAWGVDNARKSREEWEALPSVGLACTAVANEVRAEKRIDVRAVAASVKDASVAAGGRLGMNVEGKLIVEGMTERFALSRTAMTQLMKRIGPAGGGGAQYLAAVDPELRALNVNRLLSAAPKAAMLDGASEPESMFLRLRNRKGTDECYAIVSERYNALDIDVVADQIGRNLPPSMRADVTYDGQRLRVEATAHSNVAPENYAAGETFKVGVTVRTDDTGRGGLRVDGIAVRNLCLNLVILDHASKPLARITHLATADEIREGLVAALDEAQKLVGPFLRQWGMACGRREIEIARSAYGADMPVSIEEAIPGFYRALFARSDTDRLLPVSAPKAIEGVMAAWRKEPDTTRAALANAITRWGHEREGSDRFALEDAATVANRILWARTDRALPWLPEGK